MKTTINRTWLWVGAAVVAAAFLYLPSLDIGAGQLFALLMVLLCPLLHFFGMHRHGDHGGGHGPAEPRPPADPPPAAAERDRPELPR